MGAWKEKTSVNSACSRLGSGLGHGLLGQASNRADFVSLSGVRFREKRKGWGH